MDKPRLDQPPEPNALVAWVSEATEDFLTAYVRNPALRALAQVLVSPLPFGLGQAFDEAIVALINEQKQKRLRAFFMELDARPDLLTAEVIHDVDFLHAFFVSLRAAARTRRSEKARLFARLLLGSVAEGATGDDQFDEFASVLDDLSTREFALLRRLEELAGKHRKDWRQMSMELMEVAPRDLGIESALLSPMLWRLERTGLFTLTLPPASTLGAYGYRGELTPLYERFVRWLDAGAPHEASASS